MGWDEPQTLEEACGMAKALANSTLLHDTLKGSPENILLVIGFAKSMGISPFAAMRLVNVIGGKPILTADGQQAVVWRSGLCAQLEVTETTDERCVVVACRVGGKPVTISWDIERARRAGLGEPNLDRYGKEKPSMWSKYPRQMLRARVLAEACRLCWPDVVGGVYDPDELSELADSERPRALATEALPAKPLPALEPTQRALPSATEDHVEQARRQPEAKPEAPAKKSPTAAEEATRRANAARDELVAAGLGLTPEDAMAKLGAAARSLQPKGVPTEGVILRAAGMVALQMLAESIAEVGFDGDVTEATRAIEARIEGAPSIASVRAAVSAILHDDEGSDGDA